MKKNVELDPKDTYLIILVGSLYLILWVINLIGAMSHVSGWDWLALIVQSIISLVICGIAFLLSFLLVLETIKYFGLNKNYLTLTILSIIIAPLMIIVLSLVLSGFIPSLFDPRFL